MNITHIEDFFHPDAGYQINILAKYQAQAKNNVTILTSEMDRIPKRLKDFFGVSDIESRDSSFSRQTGVSIVRVPIYKYYSGRAIYHIKLFRMIKHLKPDILFIHGNDSFAGIVFTLLIRWLTFPIIMDNHMLEMATTNRLSKIFRWWYRIFISRILINRKIKVLRVVNDNFVIKRLGIPENLSPVIPLGTDTMHFHPNPERRRMMRDQTMISESDFVVLYLGKLTSDKGIDLLVKACQERFPIERQVILIIIGNISSSYGQNIESELKNSNNRVVRLPTKKYLDLPDMYLLADLVVFPKHCSLSFFDAQACGIPVLLEDNSINKNRISFGNGYTFKTGDHKDLRLKILKIAEMSQEEYTRMQHAALNFIMNQGYDYSIVLEKYQREIKECIRIYSEMKIVKKFSNVQPITDKRHCKHW